MKRKLLYLQVISLLATATWLSSCGDDAPAKPVLPTVTTIAISDITTSGAKTGGNVTNDGGSAVTARGACWSTSENPTIDDDKTSNGTGKGEFESVIESLPPNVKYYVRAYATNKVGTAYGDSKFFTTNAEVPTVVTGAVSNITFNGATIEVNISSDGGSPLIEGGVVYSIDPNPDLQSSKAQLVNPSVGTYGVIMNQLNLSTKYFIRGYAINEAGVVYGQEISFITLDHATDFDGNSYNLVTIGTQVWMAENLKTTHYKNGTVINPTEVAVYNNDNANLNIYGRLYSWYSANNPSEVCPSGMHLPSTQEWETLFLTVGGGDVAGSKLKESGNSHWKFGNSTDEFGFGALPSGYEYGGGFAQLGDLCYFWTPEENSSELSEAYGPTLTIQDNAYLQVSNYKAEKHSLRCIGD